MARKKAKTLTDEKGCAFRVVHLGRVRKARKNIEPEKTVSRLALVFKTLGDPGRLKIVMALAKGEMCVCDVAAFLGIGESAASHQLRQLRNLYLVKTRRDGQVLYYSLDDHHVEELIKIGIDHVNEE